MTRKLYIKTFGCQMNEYDSARTADLLAASHGLDRTEVPEDADVLLINTCVACGSAERSTSISRPPFSDGSAWRRPQSKGG